MNRSLTVVDPGALTTVQDQGRRGWAHLGVPRSGALDPAAASYANRLVGNPDDAAVLETTLSGVSVRAGAAMRLAVTGAPAAVSVDGRPAAFAEPVPVRSGQTLTVGPALSGVRSYLAVDGGLDVARVLGSRATDTLAGLGPPPLAAGDSLPVGAPVGPPHGVDVPVVRRHDPRVELTAVRGPRADWFTAAALDTLTRATYTVSPHSNRVGLRLHGPRLDRRHDEELPSEGIVLGAVQVPANGEPLVFLNDHPTTGGYPVVAVVVPGDLAACAQLRPGDEVRFRLRR